MWPHHQRAVAKLIDYLQEKPEFLAAILGGSIAKGTARESSDVDVYMVVTDEEFALRKKTNELFYFNEELCDYPGGYIDGKMIERRFLDSAAERGSEPTRASFRGSEVIFSRVAGLEEVVARIPVYPEQNRAKNLTDFYAQVLLYGNYFAMQALEQNNAYLRSHAVSSLVLYASRMILAHNRILFPCHKSLMDAVRQAEEKPPRFVELAENLLGEPAKEKVQAFVELISSYQDWGITYSQAVSIFVENNEWNWIDQAPPLQDR